MTMSPIIDDTSNWKFVVINTHEGASHHWFDRLIPELNQKALLPLDQIILRSACLYNPDSPIAHMGSIIDYVSDSVTEHPTIKKITVKDITHHYVCLNKLHRWQRLALVDGLINRGLHQFGKISYLAAPKQEINPDYRYLFPMVLDRKELSWQQSHDINYPALTGALFNVITESCYEPQPGSAQPQTHHLPGLTEKTYKSILSAQIPIFVAPRYTVRCYRELGFDVFDDVIDHGYDLESDPIKRLDLVVNQVEKISQLSMHDLQSLFDNNIDRFQKNLDRFHWYAHNHDADFPKWQKWIEDWKASKNLDQ